MYDLLIVGAGITAATLAARLKGTLRICIVECRPHLGGNCFDERLDGTYIHRYGPHIFHCPSDRIRVFLEQFTEWVPYTHSVTAEILDNNALRRVPFPYCRQTVERLGRELSQEEIIDLFFRGYSRKMWDIDWEDLPTSVRRRLPMELTEAPVYYRDSFVALPRLGYTHMLENMLDGVETILGAGPEEWLKIKAREVVFTGRPDLIPLPGSKAPVAQVHNLALDYRSLAIEFGTESWELPTACLHACSTTEPWTRKTHFATMTGGHSPIVSTEFPRPVELDEPVPFYPIETPVNLQRYAALAQKIREYYPNLHLAGRLGSYRYFDMYQAVGQAMALAERIWKK